MSSEIKIGGEDDDRIFLGTDGNRKFHVLDIDTDSTGATAKDMTGKTVIFDIRKKDRDSSALLSATCAVAGTFNSVAASNAQRCTWSFADTDLTTDLFGVGGGTFRYSLKDTTDTAETILQRGDIVIQRATQV